MCYTLYRREKEKKYYKGRVMPSIFINPEQLVDMYLNEGKSILCIAKRLNHSPTTIHKYLRKFEIPLRTSGEIRKGKRSNAWKSGKRYSQGYIAIYSPNHPYRTKMGYVFKHRLIVEKYLGRYLKPREITHHINNIRNDNRIDNLMVFINSVAHLKFHRDPKSVKLEEIVFGIENYRLYLLKLLKLS